MAVFDRIVMDIIDMPLQIVFIANRVLPDSDMSFPFLRPTPDNTPRGWFVLINFS